MQTWLSVIIPVYNGARYIEDMARAIDMQRMDGVEVLFIDDGSTDGSAAMLDRLPAEYGAYIRVLHQENAGVAAARNHGLACAQGRYIGFADVDDMLSPSYLASLFRAVQAGSFELLVFERCRAHEGENPFLDMRQQPLNLARILPEDLLGMFLRNPTRYGVYNMLLSSDYIRRAGLRFPEGYAYYEDYDFFVRALIGTQQILHTEAQLYCYMLRENSAMMRFDRARLQCMQLLDPLAEAVRKDCPKAARNFSKWFAARIYWSVLWQAAAALPAVNEAAAFARETGAKSYLRRLRDYPVPKVWATAWFYRICPPLYLRLAGYLGRRRSKVRAG